MNIYEIFYILTFHFIADFVFQTEWQATKKSSLRAALVQHTMVYSGIWLVASFFMFYYFRNYDLLTALMCALFFASVTLLAHTTQDHFTSRLNSKLAEKAREDGKWHNFFVAIGFDQLLHYVQLILTYKFTTL